MTQPGRDVSPRSLATPVIHNVSLWESAKIVVCLGGPTGRTIGREETTCSQSTP
jgi:hypothetical protein